MALDFPTATTVGQEYEDPASGKTFVVAVVGPPAVWKCQPSGEAAGPTVTVGENAPTDPAPVQGDLWWNDTTGILMIYYVDPNTAQWVQSVPPEGGPDLSDYVTIGTAQTITGAKTMTAGFTVVANSGDSPLNGAQPGTRLGPGGTITATHANATGVIFEGYQVAGDDPVLNSIEVEAGGKMMLAGNNINVDATGQVKISPSNGNPTDFSSTGVKLRPTGQIDICTAGEFAEVIRMGRTSVGFPLYDLSGNGEHTVRNLDQTTGQYWRGFTGTDGSTNTINLECSGTIQAVNSTIQPVSSERRLKENIAPIDPTVSWNTIRDTPYYEYNFIGQTSKVHGAMADEVPAELLIDTGESDEVGPIRTYDNGALQARLYVALQQALARIEALEARL